MELFRAIFNLKIAKALLKQVSNTYNKYIQMKQKHPGCLTVRTLSKLLTIRSLHLLLFVIFVQFCISCTKTDFSEVTSAPTIEKLGSYGAFGEDTITISGQNFSKNKEDNVVKFNGVIGQVLEADATTLKVVVPKNVTSGTLTIVVKGSNVINMGNFTVGAYDAFFFNATEGKLARVSIETGRLCYVGNRVAYGENTCGGSYLPGTNEFVGFDRNAGENIKVPAIVRIRLATQVAKLIKIQQPVTGKEFEYKDFTTDGQFGYIFVVSEKKLAKINLETGEITLIGNAISYGINTRGAVYNSKTKEYIGFENNLINEATGPVIVRINVSTGEVKYIKIADKYLANGKNFADFTIDDNGFGYAYHDGEKKLAKINLETGDINFLGNDIIYENTQGARIYKRSNEYVGLSVGINSDAIKTHTKLVRVNLNTGNVKYVVVPEKYLTNGMVLKDFSMINN